MNYINYSYKVSLTVEFNNDIAKKGILHLAEMK